MSKKANNGALKELAISRRDGQCVVIGVGQDVRIEVRRSLKGRVDLVVLAPDTVPVMREELMGDHEHAQGAREAIYGNRR